jgi:hypothetical protein
LSTYDKCHEENGAHKGVHMCALLKMAQSDGACGEEGVSPDTGRKREGQWGLLGEVHAIQREWQT